MMAKDSAKNRLRIQRFQEEGRAHTASELNTLKGGVARGSESLQIRAPPRRRGRGVNDNDSGRDQDASQSDVRKTVLPCAPWRRLWFHELILP